MAAAAPAFEFTFDTSAFAPSAAAEVSAQPAAVGSPIGSDAAPGSKESSPEASGATSPHSFSLKKAAEPKEPAEFKLDGPAPAAPVESSDPSPAAAKPAPPVPVATFGPNPNAAPFTPSSCSGTTPPPPAYGTGAAAPIPAGERTDSPPSYNPAAAMPPPPTRTNVYIAWLPRTFLEHDLLNLVAPFGDIVSVRLVQDASRSYAFVLYESREAAERALLGLNTTRVNGRRLQARISNAHDGNRAPQPPKPPQQHVFQPAFPHQPHPQPQLQQQQFQPVQHVVGGQQPIMVLQPQQQGGQQQFVQMAPANPHQAQQQQQQPVFLQAGGAQQQQQPMVLVQMPGTGMYQAVPASQLQQVQQPQQQQQHQTFFVAQQQPQQQSAPSWIRQ